MLIGEFAELTGVTPRMLRHYEEAGLLTPAGREPNGYRSYDEAQAPRARQVRQLVSSGMPTQLVASLLSALSDADGIYPRHVDPGMRQSIEDEWRRMCRCVDCMAARRDALRGYLNELDSPA